MQKLKKWWQVTASIVRGVWYAAALSWAAYAYYIVFFRPICHWLAPYYAPYAWLLTPALSIIVFSFLSIVGLIAWGIYDGYQDEVRIQKQKEFSFFQ